MNASNIDWGGGHEQSHTSAFAMVHRLLRGKYMLTIVLAIVFGVVGGVLGYLSQTPQYASMGVIRIQPSLPKVLYETEQSTGTKMFSSFVSSQAELISNGGVIQNALSSDEWLQIGGDSDIQTVSDVQKRLIVKPNRRAQEIITVSFSDKDPKVSAGIVRAVMKSYHAEYGTEGSINNPEIVNALKDRERDLLSQRAVVDEKITRITMKYRTENLSPLIQNSQYAIRQLEAQRMVLLNQIGQYEELEKMSTLSGSDEVSVEYAESHDPEFSKLVARRFDLVNSKEELMASEGLREEHRDIRRITGMIQSVQERIDQRFEELKSGGIALALVDEEGRQVPTKARLEREIAEKDKQIQIAKVTTEDLFGASVQLGTLREDHAQVQTSISQVNLRLAQIQTESQVENMKFVTGKISIPVLPTPAKEPSSDPRRKFAVMGFVGFGSLPVLAVIGIGYFSHRVQYSDDEILSGDKAGIVGLLPDLGDSLADQELASASAFAVHQLRSQLQIKNDHSETRVYGVTSPAPQDGKTSLIIAMGLSFAESGNRTLLVDLDFIGRGLSIHFGHPNSESLADVLESTEQIDMRIHQTEFSGLDILPAGFGDDERVSRLSPRSIGSLINHLRTKYDTILIDSGPILGSVEAAFVAPQADGVLMVVGRGQYKPLVKKAIEHVHAIGGTIVATVFNRASIQELRQSSSSMSVHFSRQMSRQQEAVAKRPGLRVGPVAGALFSSRAGHIGSNPEKSVNQ